MGRIVIAQAFCCPDNYNSVTGQCDVCHYCYVPIVWEEIIVTQPPESVPEYIPEPTLASEPVGYEPFKGEKHCAHCEKLFEYKRKTAAYCSVRCRVAAKREMDAADKACQQCGAKDAAPYCGVECYIAAKKERQGVTDHAQR